MDHKTSLGDFDGTLLLIGAGKMGGAMLEGWHRLGLRFDNVVLVEPQPSPEIITLGQRGLRINPALDTCERYFQAFQFVVWAGKSAAEALDATMFETSGEA